MFCMIDDGELNRMSAIIGICGENFCSFIADTRLIANFAEDHKTISDTTQKIFKINECVLFGMTGLFRAGEKVLAPFDIYQDHSVITLRMAYKAVIDYIEKNKYEMLPPRNYLIGGKDNKGKFCIYEAQVNFNTYEAEAILRIPEPPTTNYGISCSLPPKLCSRSDEFVGMVGNCVTSSNTHGEMIEKVSGVIGKIAELDDTVGGNVSALSVF